MGDPLARAIEASFGLEVGSMDKEGGVGGNPTAPVPERAQQLARHILDAASDGRLTPESFEFLEKALQMAARENREQSSSTQPANKKTARGV